MEAAHIRLRQDATYNVLIPGLPELSGIRERLETSSQRVETSMPDLERSIAIALPLYIYPTEESWKPLFEVIEKHPDIQFYTIVNPANGPGGNRPDFNYLSQVDKLNSFSNTTAFGYVHVSWANRDLNLVLEDISTWSKWTEHKDFNIHVDGIFVDEAPAEMAKLDYMKNVYVMAKKTFGGKAVVWTNPGVEIDQNFYDVADLVNSYENTHEVWQTMEKSPVTSKATAMIHSFHGTVEEQKHVVEDISRRGYAACLITTSDCYVSFSDMLKELVEDVERQ